LKSLWADFRSHKMLSKMSLTPMLMVFVLITGDFLGMAMTTDNVHPSPRPNVWRVGQMTIAGVAIGISELMFFVVVLVIGSSPFKVVCM